MSLPLALYIASMRRSIVSWLSHAAFGELLKPLLGEAFAKEFGECIRLLSSMFFSETVAGFIKSRERFGIGPLSLKTSLDCRIDRIRLSARLDTVVTAILGKSARIQLSARLDTVFTDILGKRARAIIDALRLAGAD
jgi:hypothetical protein